MLCRHFIPTLGISQTQLGSIVLNNPMGVQYQSNYAFQAMDLLKWTPMLNFLIGKINLLQSNLVNLVST